VKFLECYHATRTARFLREAKVAASVRNNHVVDIIDFGVLETSEQEPEPYMVMALLEGEALDARIERGAIADDVIVSIGLQVLSGLEAVHKAAIVHRDIKPANIFLTEDDDGGVLVRLLDFGVSQEADAANEAPMVVGTPEYMSPEQALGAPMDLRTDLYSLGVVLYEMLSGAVPFEDEDPCRVVALVAGAKVMPLHTLRPDIPGLASIVDRAMRRAPNARWASAREMRHALLDTVGRGRDVSGRYPALRHASLPPPENDTPPVVRAESRSVEPGARSTLSRGIGPRIAVAFTLVVLTTGALAWAALGHGDVSASTSLDVARIAPSALAVAQPLAAPPIAPPSIAPPSIAPPPIAPATIVPAPIAPEPAEAHETPAATEVVVARAPETHVVRRHRTRARRLHRAPVLHRVLDF